MDTEVDVQQVLANMRETIGNLAQDNAILRAQIKTLQGTTE
jgi:cell division protein FtsB